MSEVDSVVVDVGIFKKSYCKVDLYISRFIEETKVKSDKLN